MEAWQLLLLAFAGFASGWINVIAGGGSLLTVPVVVFMELPGPGANGTNRIAACRRAWLRPRPSAPISARASA